MIRWPALLRLGLTVCAALAPAGCAENPVTGRSDFVLMSEQEEVRTGTKADEEIRQEYGDYDAPGLQAYVGKIGHKLGAASHRPQLKYHFTVVDSQEVNAFALPGGYVYVTRGILAYLDSEAELAAVLGHEIGHVTARHSVQQMSASTAANVGIVVAGILVPELGGQVGQTVLGTLGQALLSGYGRDHELEADRLGAEYLARTGYDPQAMIRVIGVLKNQELFDAEQAKREGRKPRRYHGVFASHPDNDARLKEVVSEAAKVAVVRPAVANNREEFLRAIDGLVFGDSPEQGLVRNNALLHPALGLRVQFPVGWKVTNAADRVNAVNPGRDAVIDLVTVPAKGSPEELLRAKVKLDPGAQLARLTVNGLPAAHMSGSRQGSPMQAGTVFLENRAFVLLGATKATQGQKALTEAFAATLNSIRELSASERAELKPHRIRLISAGAGTTMARLAEKSPLGPYAESYLRLINGLYPRGEPSPGQLLKIVE
jgi:predicted Zn-dependent protease